MQRMGPVACLLLFLAAGCAKRSPYGNFVASAPLDADLLARDATHALVTFYPPALTRIRIPELSPDAFGAALVEGLRKRGYAVDSGPALGDEAGKLLRYVVDSAGDNALYQVTLLVDGHTLARPYRLEKGVLAPAGLWVHKE